MALRSRNMLHQSSKPKLFSSWTFASTTSVTGKPLGAWPSTATGKLVDVIFSQPVAGANGTSVTLTVKKNGTSVCSTDAALSQTDGNNATVGVSNGTKPAGATRPVLKTDGTNVFSYGDNVTFDVTTAGTYSTTFPTVMVTLVFEELYGV